MSVDNAVQSSIEDLQEDFEDTPKGQYARWTTEFDAADKAHRQFFKKGDKVVNRYLNNTKANSTEYDINDAASEQFRLTFFHSTVNTIQDMMFGKLPEVAFKRSDDDPDDDAARVAASIFERMLNSDIGTNADDYSQALRDTLEDRLIPGMGIARVRYEFEAEDIDLPEMLAEDGETVIFEATSTTEITNESAPIDYIHWRDYKWSPCRRWEEKRWEAFRTYPDREELIEKFGEKVGKKIPLDADPMQDGRNDETTTDSSTDALMRAEIWEIWDKDSGEVIWYCKNYKRIIKTEDDPLELDNFFPTPKPLAANVTTSSYIPIADYEYAQDLYNEIDLIETRIVHLIAAVRAVGVHDGSIDELGQMFNDTGEAEMVGITDWAKFAEKGGLAGAVDWMPIEPIAKTAMILVERRDDLIKLLYQITGIADIMRGGSQQAGGAVSATERVLESKFASVKIQALQDEFARFATDLIRLRAEVVSKHFEPQSIIEQSNIMRTADAQNVPAAMQLIKDDDSIMYRVEVKPESVAMVDYAQLKEERTAYITGLATFMQSAAPLIEFDKSVTPTLLALLKWGMAGFKGSQDIEGVLDQAINQITKRLSDPQAQQKEKSPEQIKQETEQQKQQFEMQKLRAVGMQEQRKMQHERFMAKLNAQISGQTIEMESEADLNREVAQAGLNMEEKTHETNEAIREASEIADIEQAHETSNE